MKVNHPNSRAIAGSGVADTGRAAQLKKIKKHSEGTSAKSMEGAMGSRAEISSRAQEMSKAKDSARFAPEVREELIAKLRERIQKGEYNVKPDAIADKMVDEHIQLRDIG